MRKIALFVFIIFSINCFAQNNFKDSLLQKIYNLQAKNDKFFNDGLFSSVRVTKKGKNEKLDNNIFFTALITYTLQEIKSEFDSNQQILIDTIISRAKSNYFRYKSRRGELAYNFWQTKPEMPMPNSKFWSKRKRFLLPDDLDDSSIIFLTLNNGKKLDSLLKQSMIKHTNSSQKKFKGTLKEYRNYEAYYSWFGKKMKQDLDISIMSNVLLFVFQKNLELNKHDTATMHLIKAMIMNNAHKNNPNIVSPWYQNSSIILYNVSRLVQIANHEILNSIKEKLIKDIENQLFGVDNKMERIILETSLMRLKNQPKKEFKIENIAKDFKKFKYFYINPISGNSMFLKKIIGKRNMFYYYSEAYYWTLILENLVYFDKAKY
jgi:hypothetical protein